MNKLERASRTSGRRLYREIWKTVDKLFYDGERLKEADWAGKKNLYDARIVDDESALACAAEALACLDDAYTRLVPEVQFQQHVQEREDVEESAVFSEDLPGQHRLHPHHVLLAVQHLSASDGRGGADQKLRDAFIVDVRDNGGGLLNQTANCCEYFVAEGLISGFVRRTPKGLYERASCLNQRAFVVIEEKERRGAQTQAVHAPTCAARRQAYRRAHQRAYGKLR